LKKVFLRSGRIVSDEEIENIFNEINMQVDEKISLERFTELLDVKKNNLLSPMTSTASRSCRNSFRDDLDWEFTQSWKMD